MIAVVLFVSCPLTTGERSVRVLVDDGIRFHEATLRQPTLRHNEDAKKIAVLVSCCGLFLIHAAFPHVVVG